jgi:hypothetical protein
MRGRGVPEWVLRIAGEHVKGLRPVEGFVWRLAEGQRVEEGWYFDYEVERLPSNPPRPGSGFGYAPGFLVRPDGSIQVIRWGELRGVRGRRRQK